MRIAVVGMGHVGLVTAGTLAHLGHYVVGVDADPERVATLERDSMPFFEPGLESLVRDELSAERLRFVGAIRDAVRDATVAFICVGTPPDADGDANLRAVECAAEEIAGAATGPLLVVEKSTVPAGTADRVAATLRRRRPDISFRLASNPEFLREGSAVEDSLQPTRVLVGAEDPEVFRTMRAVYAPLVDRGAAWIETDIVTAELAKHACNAFLALKISYANALARLCERAGADVTAVTTVMGADPRIGSAFLDAGLGYGGYCFPKDIAAFGALARRLGYSFPLLDEVVRINDEAVDAVLSLIKEALWNLSGKRVAVLGLAFKPMTDDVRFSPSVELASRLIAAGAEVVAHDPQALEAVKSQMPGLVLSPDPYDAATGAHALVVATAWPAYLSLDWPELRERMADPIVVDARNALDPTVIGLAGLEYHAIGRGRRVAHEVT
jgi:UDPglucose 6-dehydrogenase